MSHDPGERREGQLSRDRDTIREWAREHDATPIRETEQEGESGRFRMVPKDEMTETHEEVEWEEFFDQLDEGDHVVIYHADGDREPFEIIGQSSIASRFDDEEIEQRLMDGETVTSTITETTVVESVVVEEITVDSELVDTQMVDERVVDAELLRRECTDCELVTDETADSREGFATDRYLETVAGHVAGESVGSMEAASRGSATERTSMDATEQTETTAPEAVDAREPGAGSETTGMTESASESTRASESGLGSDPETGDRTFPFHAELEVEETWAVTRSFTEQFIVESVVTDTEVTGGETIEDYDIEIEGLHRSIVESGIIKEDVPTDEAMAEYEIQSELADQDRITTTFARERTVEDEIVDTALATATVTETRPLEMEVVRTKALETTAATSDTHRETEAGEAVDAGEEEPAHSTAGEETGSLVTITRDAIGHPVVNAKGERIGLVTEVEEEANALFIDPEPGLTERIRSALGWGNAADDDYRLEAEAIDRITDDRVELKSPEEFD